MKAYLRKNLKTYEIEFRSQNLTEVCRNVFYGFFAMMGTDFVPQNSLIFWQNNLVWEGSVWLTDLNKLLERKNYLIVHLNRLQILFLLRELKRFKNSIQFYVMPGYQISRIDSILKFIERQKFAWITLDSYGPVESENHRLNSIKPKHRSKCLLNPQDRKLVLFS